MYRRDVICLLRGACFGCAIGSCFQICPARVMRVLNGMRCRKCRVSDNKCLRDMISTCEWGQTRRSAPTETPFCRDDPVWLPLASRVAQVENPPHRHLYQSHGRSLHMPPPAGSPRFARGTARAHPVPPARRGNLKEGVFTLTCFCELWLRDWFKPSSLLCAPRCVVPCGCGARWRGSRPCVPRCAGATRP